MTLFSTISAVSRRVAQTASRLTKGRELAECLRAIEREEVPIAIAFLSGQTRRGRLRVSYATLRIARDVVPGEKPELTISDVDAAFGELAAISGAGATAARKQRLEALMAHATAEEQDFLMRLIVGELRQGALQALVLEAVAAAAGVAITDVRKAAMSAGGVGEVAQALLFEGKSALNRFAIRLMQPMSSQSALDTAAALQTLGAAAFEWKIDGARVQIHKAGNEVRVYTRNLNDVTQRVPEIVALVRPASERFRLLAGSVPPDSLIPRIVTGDPAEATEFFEQAIVHGHEGVMAKSESLDAPCEAGRRGAGRIKIKRANTLDLVVLAAEWGHGRRRGWLSNLHLGARDQNGGYVMLGKTFKGLTNQMLEWQAQEFLKRETVRDAAAVHLRPEVVVEVAFNEVQASSRYPGGLALRFARVKGYRPDKRRDEADTIETVRQLYSAQVHAGGPQDPAARS